MAALCFGKLFVIRAANSRLTGDLGGREENSNVKLSITVNASSAVSDEEEEEVEEGRG